MEQERVNQFADATDDHQYIHVDVERAKESPFGGTIAHGFLTLSLVAPIIGRARRRSPTPRPASTTAWTGCASPRRCRSGAEWRGGAELLEVSEVPGGKQMKLRVTVEVKGSEKPAMVAESLVRLYG